MPLLRAIHNGRNVDWRRTVPATTVKNPVETQYVIQPGASQIIFQGNRTIGIDGTSAFQIALNAFNSSVYRISNTGGTAPVFRTDRGLNLTGDSVTWSINNNASATVTVVAQNFSAVVIGDNVWVPSTLTGDQSLSSPFSATNGGLWVVIGKASGGTPKTITLIRPPGQAFSGMAEVQTVTAQAQFVVFSAAGVQIGDTLEISSGFSVVTQSSYTVTNVLPSFIEIASTISLPLETGILPTASGIVFYLSNKRFLRLETDTEIAVRFNGLVGGSDQSIRVSPRVISDPNNVGWAEKWGVTWAMEVQNRSRTGSATVIVFSCE